MTTPVPSVPNFIAGYGPQQSDMYSLWTNPAAFFQQRVVLRVQQSSTNTTLLSSGASATISFDSVLEDPYNGWTGSPAFNWTPPTGFGGWFLVTLTCFVQSPGATGVTLSVNLIPRSEVTNAIESTLLPNNTGGASGQFIVYLAGGQDAVAGQASVHNSGSNMATKAGPTGQNSHMEIIWLMS